MFRRALVCIAVAVAAFAASDEMTAVLVAARNRAMAGQFVAARALVDQALARWPDSADVVDALGALEQDMGDYHRAEHSYRKALAMTKPDANLQRGRALNNLVTLYLETDQPSKLVEVAKDLEAIPFEDIAQSPPDAATILTTLAAIRRERGDDSGAEKLYEQSIDWWRRARNAEAMVGYVQTSLGNLHFQEGKIEEAEMYFEQAVDGVQDSLGPDHPMLIRPLYGLAASECRTGNAEAAEPIAKRAVEISKKRMGPRHPFTAKVLLLQAFVDRKLGRKRQAAALEKEANEILRDVSTRNVSGHTIDVRDLAPKKPRG